MAFSRNKEQTHMVLALAATQSAEVLFYLPTASRIKRYFAVPSVAEAADAAKVLDVTFVNEGTDGSGTDTLAVLTNDSDLDSDLTRVSGAWAAHTVKALNTEDRPTGGATTNVADEIEAGSTIKCTVAKAADTATGNVLVGIEYVEST